jgi:WD40 repeat protein
MTEEDAFEFAKQVLGHLQLNTVQEVVFRQTWSGRSYIQIANAYDYDYGYIKDIGSQLWKLLSQSLGQKVKKQNLKAVLAQCCHQRQQSDKSVTVHRQDWGEAIDTTIFYGRTTELNTLTDWVVQDRCRLVAILGMGGMGKTSLAVKFAQQHQNSFDCLIWRSLFNAPLLEDLLADLLQNLSPWPIERPSINISAQISELLNLLQQQRCLVIFDNMESLFQQGTTVGTYLPGYENYQDLLKKLAEVSHQSCVMLTSREKPPQVTWSTAAFTPARALLLPGLMLTDGQAIFADQGFDAMDATDLATVVNHYGGNPLALKIVAAGIQEMLGGELRSLLPFLQSNLLQFTDINDILSRQLTRISPSEQIVMYWLMVNRVSVSLETLATDIYPGISTPLPQLLLAIQSLKRRSLVEQSAWGYYLQPVVMEFITAHLITQVTEEIINSQPNILCHTALLKSQSQNYIRQTQIRQVLQPILQRLNQKLGNNQALSIQSLRSLLHQLQQLPPQSLLFPAYAPGNLLNLLQIAQSDLMYLDCSQLPIWQADLVGSTLQNTNFSGVTFQDCLFTQPFSAVLHVVFSPDGHFLAASNANSEIQIWRLQDGQCHQTLSGHQNWVRGLSFSPNGQLLASSSDDLTVRIWDIETGTSQKTIQSSSFPLSATFCPTGQQLVTTHADGHIKIWNVATWQLCQEFAAHQGWACRTGFSPDGQQLVSSGADGVVKLWDLQGRCIHEMHGHHGWVFPVMFSPDGQKILSAALDQTVRIWDARTGDCLHVLTGHTGWVWSVAFSPDGQQVASTGNDQTVRLWSAQSGSCQRVIPAHTSPVWSVAYHPAGDRIATGSEDQTIRMWDPRDGKCLQVIQGWLNWVLAIDFHPNGQYLVSGHNDHVVRVWDLDSQKCTQELIGHRQPVRAVAHHPILPIFVSGSDDATIKVWNMADPVAVCSHTMSSHTDIISALDFSPNGQLLASASGDATIRLWNPLQNECIACLTGHQDKVRDVEFSACGQYLVSVSEDQTAKIWDVQTQQCLCTFLGHTARIIAGSFHPDGHQVASAGQDNHIKIWNVKTAALVLDIPYPGGWLLSLTYSPCGQWLISAGNDHQVCIWDAVTGACIQSIAKHTNWVWDIAINPVDGSIASASADEMICFWEWQTWQSTKVLRVARPYENMDITAIQGLTAAQKENLKKLGAVEVPYFPPPANQKLLPINFPKKKERFSDSR